MTTVLKKNLSSKSCSSFNDDFEKYLKKQTLKTTFNGNEVAAFSWYKKVMGLA